MHARTRLLKTTSARAAMFVLALIACDPAPAAVGAQIVKPVADAYVNASRPTTNFGRAWRLRADASPVLRSYLRFDLSGIEGTIARATLRVYTTSVSVKGFQVRNVASTSWGERTVTYANAPAVAVTIVGRSSSFGSGTWINVDVTSIVVRGKLSVALTTPSEAGLAVASREDTTFAPRLIVETTAPPAMPPATRLPPLSVVGNHIFRNGSVFTFHGVNRDSLEWGRYNWGGCGGDGHFTERDFDNIANWKVNAVRVPLSQAGWLGRRCDSAAYKVMVDDAVAKANARGLYAILDLHWSDVQGKAPCDSGCTTGQQPMPDADSLVFWREVAARYGRNPGVIFSLYNEPHDVSWACWRNGGCQTTSSVQTGSVPYTAVGMQRLYDAVRLYAPDNLVLIAGLDWAYDLSGVGNGYAVSGGNIAYDTHVYVRWHSTRADWDAHFGFLTRSYPVTATEFGSTNCSSNVTQPLLDYFNAPLGVPGNKMSWTIWSWNSPGSCGQPSVIADWNGTPLSDQGKLVYDALQAYAR